MALGMAAASAVAPRSAAAPVDRGFKVNTEPQNMRVDEAAPRRAEKKARMEQAQAQANQVAKRVFDIQTVDEKAWADATRIDTYA